MFITSKKNQDGIELIYRLSNTTLLRHLSASLFNAVRLLHVIAKNPKKSKIKIRF